MVDFKEEVIQRAQKLGLESDRFESHRMGSSCQEKIDKIKLKDRSYLTLKQWNEQDFKSSDICKKLLENCPENIDRIDYESVSLKSF